MYNAILDEIDRQCPILIIKEITLKKVQPMWTNDYLLYLVNDRDKKFKRAKQTDNREEWLEARKLRNLTKKGVDKARADFTKSNLNSCKNDSKKFWKELREILPNDKSNKRFGLVDQSSRHRVEENNTANYINKYFSEVGPELASKFKGNQWQNTLDQVSSLFNFMEVTAGAPYNVDIMYRHFYCNRSGLVRWSTSLGEIYWCQCHMAMLAQRARTKIITGVGELRTHE